MIRYVKLFNKPSNWFSLKKQQDQMATQKKKIERNIDESKRLFQEGKLLHQSNDLEKAIFYYSKSIQNDEYHANPILHMGCAYQQLQNHIKAIECFEKYLKIKPNDSQIFPFLANSFYHLNNYNDAIKYFHKSLIKNNNDPFIYYNLAMAYERLSENNNNQSNNSDLEKAMLLYKKAISLDDKLKYAYNNLGSIYYSKNLFTKAIDYLKQAINIDNSFSDAYFNLSQVYMKQEKYEEAIQCLEQALQFDQSNGQIFYNLGILYNKIGNEYKAKEYIMKTKQLLTDDQINLNESLENKNL